jgi:hypothetical protein
MNYKAHNKKTIKSISISNLKIVLIKITVLAIISIFFLSPIPQDQSYHQFADQRTLLSIPNFWNVFSNIGFLFVGAIGLYKLHISNSLNIVRAIKYSYSIFFIGIFFVSFGSAYYHWQPNNHTLIWDRLPMTLAFMSLTSIVFAEFLSIKFGRVNLIPLLFIGLFSVGYWYWGELHGEGDLRLYALVQFLPIILLLLLLLFGKPIFQSKYGYWELILGYSLAKLAEHFDVKIYKLTSGIISGHTLKHIFAAIGLLMLIRYFEKRKNSLASSQL